MAEPVNAAERFRLAVDRRDVAAMIDTFSPDIELHSPTNLMPVNGRERVRVIFGMLSDLFQDFEYLRTFDGDLVVADPMIVSSHALMFRCRIDDEQIEGVDILDVDGTDHIARLTVLIRPMAGLHMLADSIAARVSALRPAQH